MFLALQMIFSLYNTVLMTETTTKCHGHKGPLFQRDNIQTEHAAGNNKLCVLMGMPCLKDKIDLQSFLGFMNYLGKYFPVTAEICEPLR